MSPWYWTIVLMKKSNEVLIRALVELAKERANALAKVQELKDQLNRVKGQLMLKDRAKGS